VDAPAEEGGAGVSFGVVAEEIGVVEFGVEPDDFPFVDVTVVFGPLTVPAAGVGDFEGEAEGVEDIVDSGVEAGAVEERFVGSGGGAADVVVAVFEADAVVEAEVEPCGALPVGGAFDGGAAGVFGGIGVAGGADAEGSAVVAGRFCGRGDGGWRCEEQRAGESHGEEGRRHGCFCLWKLH